MTDLTTREDTLFDTRGMKSAEMSEKHAICRKKSAPATTTISPRREIDAFAADRIRATAVFYLRCPMLQVDSSGYMKVEIGGDVIRRRAEITVAAHYGDGAPSMRARPELRAGEILCERIGMMPLILATEGIGGA